MDTSNRNFALTSALASELARCGTTDVVISPGSRSTPLAVALDRQPELTTHISVDERSGGFFALGAAQATGKPVALVCTSGTAAANFLPAVAEADASNVPLLILTADRPPELRDTGAGQTIDQLKLYGERVRWFFEVGDLPADDQGLTYFRSVASRAWATAAGQPRPGPVHLNLFFREPLAPIEEPGSVTASSPLALEGRPGGRPFTEYIGSGASLEPGAATQVEALTAPAKRVLILAGRSARPSSRAAVIELATALNAPVLAEPTSQLRLGSPPVPNLIWRYGEILKERSGDLAPDLIIRIGELPTSKVLRQWTRDVGESVPELVVDPSWSFHDPGRMASMVLRTGLEDLTPLLIGSVKGDAGYRDFWMAAQDDLPPVADSDGQELDPAGAFAVIGSALRDEDLVYTASSMAIRDQESFLPPDSSDVLFLANRGANGIDGLLASGFGAAATTGRRTLIVTGDLGFQHDVGSLALARDLDARIIVFDSGGGAIFDLLPQKGSMPPEEFERLMTTPGRMDIAAAASLFGIAHAKATSPEDLAVSLGKGGPLVIEVPLVR